MKKVDFPPALPSRRHVSVVPECLFNNGLREVLCFPAPEANWGQQFQMCCSACRIIKELHSNKPAGQSLEKREHQSRLSGFNLLLRTASRLSAPDGSPTLSSGGSGVGGHGFCRSLVLLCFCLLQRKITPAIKAEMCGAANLIRTRRLPGGGHVWLVSSFNISEGRSSSAAGLFFIKLTLVTPY